MLSSDSDGYQKVLFKKMCCKHMIFLCPNYPATCVHEKWKIDYDYPSQLILNKKQQLILDSVQSKIVSIVVSIITI